MDSAKVRLSSRGVADVGMGGSDAAVHCSCKAAGVLTRASIFSGSGRTIFGDLSFVMRVTKSRKPGSLMSRSLKRVPRRALLAGSPWPWRSKRSTRSSNHRALARADDAGGAERTAVEAELASISSKPTRAASASPLIVTDGLTAASKRHVGSPCSLMLKTWTR